METLRKLRPVALLVLVTGAVGAGAVAVPVATAAPAGITAVDTLEADLLVEINALRRRHGLASLRLSRSLRAAADAHSNSMAARGFFAHESADGTAFWKRVRSSYVQSGYRSWSVGENLLWASPDIDAKAAVTMWLNSPSHRRILLTARWREIGLSAVHVDAAPAAFQGREVTIVTADFGVRS
jgi:uncharacterized protein YkwD